MSTTLLVMTPFVLLAIVSSLCFVGCWLPSYDNNVPEDTTVAQYSDDTVLADTDRLLAYWRLNEASGPPAINAANPGTADGVYVSQKFPDDAAVNSVAAPGTLTFGEPGMLAGDLLPPGTAGSPRQPAVFVDGAFVSVAWDPTIAPSEADGFTIEAWVNVGWGEKEPKADRAVLVSLEPSGAGFTGFGIIAAMDQTWQAFIGTGTSVEFAPGSTVAFGSDHHLVATYAAGELRLYVNGVQSSATISATYAPTTGVSTTGLPSRLFIGAGGPQLPEPRIPFVGKMQCVALYRGAFSDDDVLKHFKNGNGTTS